MPSSRYLRFTSSAIIKVLMQIAEACKLEGKPVSICGEMASDPASVIILMALDLMHSV